MWRRDWDVVDKVALGQVFLQYFSFPLAVSFTPMLYNHLHLHVALTGRTTGRSLGTFHEAARHSNSHEKSCSGPTDNRTGHNVTLAQGCRLGS
jgi:hypothetical protein